MYELKQFLGQFISQKKVLILGFGREGRSTFRLLREVGGYAELGISDLHPIELSDEGIMLYSGTHYLDVMDDYDIVFKSPGVVLPKEFSAYSCLITSQMELFLSYFSRQVIGITGTKGKSTTSSLLYHILSENGVDCIFAGNIGIPVFEIVDEIHDSTVIVLEMSCHQLEHIACSPSVAVFLNLYEDHLDHYGSFEKYADAKRNIYRHQKADDVLFCNPQIKPSEAECASQVIDIDTAVLPQGTEDATRLKGQHNLFNIAVVYQICRRLQVDTQGFLDSLATFQPLAHRLEYVGMLDGVAYYDDSISTTVESTINAIKSIKNAGSVLIGGMDRGIAYDALVDFLIDCSLDEVILMYDSGKRIYEVICQKLGNQKGSPRFVYLSDLQSAVEYARKHTQIGKACILSPAAASYGVFKNFEERGKEFCRLVFNK